MCILVFPSYFSKVIEEKPFLGGGGGVGSTPKVKKGLAPLMKENPWVLCLVQQSNYPHQTRLGCHT